MGGGSYCHSSALSRSVDMGYHTKSTREVFTRNSINNAMSPHGLKVRESRDSAEHPESLAIIIALDVTGSMGSVPHHLVKEGLPNIMKRILDAGIADPQVLFLGIGDHEYDSSPLQVGQFESSDELLDKWLTDVYLEGGGGGNDGESYALAWYFAANHTSIDCLEKRNQKGFLFTIGDEPALLDYPRSALNAIMGDGQYANSHASELLDRAREKYNCFHIHIKETTSGSLGDRIPKWKELIQSNLLEANQHIQVADLIASAIMENIGVTGTKSEPVKRKVPKKETPEKEEEIIL